MKKSNKLSIICFATSWILSNIMSIFVTYKWMDLLYHQENSAPPETTLIYSIPFLIVIALLLAIGIKRKRGDV